MSDQQPEALPLSNRVRPNIEAAPWVCEAIAEQENELRRLHAENERLREQVQKATQRAAEWADIAGGHGAAADILRAENKRLREFEREAIALLPGVYYMDPPDGGNVEPIEQLRRMGEDAERYRWLRGDSCADHSARWTRWEVRCWRAPAWTSDLRRDALDTAIDAARRKA